ncbi:hypothetical protein Q8F55_003362 [Vanrija albida]|uniref:Mid2 domain-containing protein n=1 Tax=Vanrija albida TaxID=181172 RepID=A0ABR3Q3Q6_9TREE
MRSAIALTLAGALLTTAAATAAPPDATITPAPHPLYRRAPTFTPLTHTVPAYSPFFAYGPNDLTDPNAKQPSRPDNTTVTWQFGGVPSYAQGVLGDFADNVVYADQANPKGVKTPGNLTLSFYGTGVKLYGYCKNDTQLNAWFDGNSYTGQFQCRDFSGSSNLIFATDSQPFQGHTLALGLYYSRLVVAYAEITTNVYSWQSTATDQLTQVDQGALTSNGSVNEYFDVRQGQWNTVWTTDTNAVLSMRVPVNTTYVEVKAPLGPDMGNYWFNLSLPSISGETNYSRQAWRQTVNPPTTLWYASLDPTQQYTLNLTSPDGGKVAMSTVNFKLADNFPKVNSTDVATSVASWRNKPTNKPGGIHISAKAGMWIGIGVGALIVAIILIAVLFRFGLMHLRRRDRHKRLSALPEGTGLNRLKSVYRPLRPDDDDHEDAFTVPRDAPPVPRLPRQYSTPY